MLVGGSIGVGRTPGTKTSEIKHYDATIQGRNVVFIDTPGSNDAERTDTDVLSQISSYLAET